MTDPLDPIRENEALWDAWTGIHEASAFYDIDGFRRGGIRLREEEVAAVGEVHGRTLLHLQCHFGIDTLSWARLGARVTGVDFSQKAVDLATRLAADIGIADARFIRSDLYDLPNVLDEQFDIVYTSRGVIGWLPDIRLWAEVVAHFTAPGGRFFITEIHPVAQAFENEGVGPGELRLAYPYWEHRDPLTFDVHGSYADPRPTRPACANTAGTTAWVSS
jgi:SAM-dependent methyltransferase